MAEAEISKLAEPDFTVSLTAGHKHVVVDDEPAIPPAYWKPQPPKLDRLQLLAKLKSGEEIPGVSLSNARPAITIRTK